MKYLSTKSDTDKINDINDALMLIMEVLKEYPMPMIDGMREKLKDQITIMDRFKIFDDGQ
jgi:hypothetical protein